jgi:hypothetical protein
VFEEGMAVVRAMAAEEEAVLGTAGGVAGRRELAERGVVVPAMVMAAETATVTQEMTCKTCSNEALHSRRSRFLKRIQSTWNPRHHHHTCRLWQVVHEHHIRCCRNSPEER